MRHSEERILTTHVGALPEPAALRKGAANYEDELRRAVADVVHRQRDTGLDAEKLNRIADYWTAVREFYLPFDSVMPPVNDVNVA